MIRASIILAAVLASGTAGAETPRLCSQGVRVSDWCLLDIPAPSRLSAGSNVAGASRPSFTLYTQTYGGRIGIVHDLTKDECETRRKQALGEPATAEEKAAAKLFAVQNDPCHGAPTCGFVSSVDGVPLDAVYTHISSDVRHAECHGKPLP